MKVWFARVSTTGQSLDIQIEKLQSYGCDKIYTEKKSGAKKQARTILNEMLSFIREWDELVITRLDRLARSVLDLSNITKKLNDQNINLVVLDQHIDTTSPTGKLLFNVLWAIGEFERELINERVSDWITKAKRNWVKFWPKPKLSNEQIRQLRLEFKQSSPKSRSQLAKKYWIGKTTLYRLAK